MTEPDLPTGRGGRAANIFDVARLAGVSHQTVSRVINEMPNVRPATRARVERAIAQLHYSPSPAARALVTRRTRTIGLVTPGISDYGPTSIAMAFNFAARAARYSVETVSAPPDDPKAIRSVIDSLLRQRSRTELERMAASSPLNATANSALAQLAIQEHRLADARANLEHALTVDSRTPLAHLRLGQLAIAEEKPLAAIEHFEQERKIGGAVPGLELGLGVAWQLAGDATSARKHFEKEIRAHPGTVQAGAAENALRR